jgi:hypothetical protein
LSSNNNFLLDSKTQRLTFPKSLPNSLNKEDQITLTSSKNLTNKSNRILKNSLSRRNKGSHSSLAKLMKISMTNSMTLMKVQ